MKNIIILINLILTISLLITCLSIKSKLTNISTVGGVCILSSIEKNQDKILSISNNSILGNENEKGSIILGLLNDCN